MTAADVFDREALIAARQARGMSLRELARRSGVSQPSLSAYESGRSIPGVLSIAKIARALGIPANRLVRW